MVDWPLNEEGYGTLTIPSRPVNEVEAKDGGR